MILVVSIVSISVLVLAFWIARVIPVAMGSFETAHEAINVIRDPAVDDKKREKAAQTASIRLLRTLVSIFVRSILSVAVAFVPIYISDLLHLAPMERVITFLSRWEVAIGTMVVFSIGYLARASLRKLS